MSITHSLASTYRHGCRCEPCRKAHTIQFAKEKKLRTARGLPDGDPRHGTWASYNNWGCRCQECRAEGSRVNRLARERRAAS